MRTFIAISPQYPPRLRFFYNRLKAHGFNVVGVGDADFNCLDEGLRSDLAEYCRVDLACYSNNEDIDPARYGAVLDTVRYLSDKYGGAEYLESFNEWWLPLDAALRRDLGIPGLRPEALSHLVRKSLMKERFRAAGVAVVDGQELGDLGGMLSFLDRCGGDMVVKPDRGVGASDTHRIRSRQEAESFFLGRDMSIPYYMEKFIGGADRELFSFDGFTDAEGAPVFYTAHHYNDGIMEVVGGNPLSYYNLRASEIPAGLKSAGLAAVRAFGMKKNFFHIEFFRSGGVYYGLEINARPPGVLTLDMVNYSKGFDCWDLYARMCAGEKLEVKPPCDLVCSYVARVFDRDYKLSHDELLAKFPGEIVFHMPMDSKVMGDYSYLVRTKDQKRREEVMAAIVE